MAEEAETDVATGTRKKNVRGGHRAHLRKLYADVANLLSGYTEESEAKVLTLKACLERKATILAKLDEEISRED